MQMIWLNLTKTLCRDLHSRHQGRMPLVSVFFAQSLTPVHVVVRVPSDMSCNVL